jgi:hypothetical protein
MQKIQKQIKVVEKIISGNNLLQLEIEKGFHFEHTFMSMPYNRIIYIESTKPVLLLHVGYSKMNDSNESYFNECFELLKSYEMEALLFLITTYRINPAACLQFLQRNTTAPMSKKWPHSILHTSYGCLLYAYQFEQLYSMITGCSHTQAVMIRRAWNKKVIHVRNTVSKLEIITGYSMGQFIQEHTWDENMFFYAPQYSGAFQLWRALQLSHLESKPVKD